MSVHDDVKEVPLPDNDRQAFDLLISLIDKSPTYEDYVPGKGYKYVCCFCSRYQSHDDDCLITKARKLTGH